MFVGETRERPIVISQEDAIGSNRASLEELADDEHNGYGWGTMYTGVKKYEARFRPVFRTKFKKLLAEKIRNGEESAVLDFMGFGVMFEKARRKDDFPDVHGVSLSLGHWDKTPIKSITPATKIVHIGGNILYEEAWETLDEVLRRLNEKKFGLIVWAPAGATDSAYLTKSPEVYQEILQRLWDRLSQQKGVLLVELPIHIVQTSQFKQWKKKLSAMQLRLLKFNLYKWNKHVMKLEKTPLLPQLPPIVTA